MMLSRKNQHGATLIVTLILLVMMTVLGVSAMTMGLTNQKIVANMQFRSEATAAANQAIEQVISVDFTTAPMAQTIPVDIDQDGTDDYTVSIALPTCIGTRTILMSELQISRPGDADCSAGSQIGAIESMCADTQWDIKADVQDATTGAVTTIRQGIQKRIARHLAAGYCT